MENSPSERPLERSTLFKGGISARKTCRKRRCQRLCTKHKVTWPAIGKFPEASLHDRFSLVRRTERSRNFSWVKPKCFLREPAAFRFDERDVETELGLESEALAQERAGNR
jgi:hypothetical protein